MESSTSSQAKRYENVANSHKESQKLNPFSPTHNEGSSKQTLSHDQYGRPIHGSLTEMRGQKANIHVYKEMLELCEVINSEGFPLSPSNPDLKFILFGDLFSIYTHISNKLVGVLLRTRKHGIIDFEGEMLFQRRDDDVPILMSKPIEEIRHLLLHKQDEIGSSMSSNPQPTTVLMGETSN